MNKPELLTAYRNMLRARSFDRALINLYRQSKIVGGVYAQVGNEATSVGTAMALHEGDILFPKHREWCILRMGVRHEMSKCKSR
jgi:pyruvate dehydrogenase E1 component alpha subunit